MFGICITVSFALLYKLRLAELLLQHIHFIKFYFRDLREERRLLQIKIPDLSRGLALEGILHNLPKCLISIA